MEIQKITALALMDLLATFNTVPHDGLIEVLKCKFGLEGTHSSGLKSTAGQGFSRLASTVNTQKQKS